MSFLSHYLPPESAAYAVLIFSLVIAFGLFLGSVRILGVHMGIAGVLFAGLVFGHYGIRVDERVIEFTRELGLILFVYTIGLQVGPGFFSSFKREGLSLNLMAAFIVAFGVFITYLLIQFADIPVPAAVGLFSGATTNTPSLAAAEQTLRELPGISAELLKMPGLGYAVAYPFGVIGIILTMAFIKLFFRVDLNREIKDHDKKRGQEIKPLESVDLKVENANLHGLAISKIPGIAASGIVISRVSHDGAIRVALPATRIFLGDIIHAVGYQEKLEALQLIVGSKSDIDLKKAKSDIDSRRIIITRHSVAGKSLAELDIFNRYAVTVTRISRAEIEFAASPEVKLQYADSLLVVGEADDVKEFAAVMGDSPKHLDHPQMVPVFVGIALGVLLGSIPFHFPGIPAPVKLGLAGGPLIAAIILSRVGRIGKLVWYMPISANFMLRELGITLFLASVGLKAGDRFVQTLLYGNGFYWMTAAALITILPILITAVFARTKMKMNYLSLCGLLAGSMTDPPALAFANNLAVSTAPSISYATVYPLVMILRIMAAQILILLIR